MAHHQGMTVIAIANALHDGAMRTRSNTLFDPLTRIFLRVVVNALGEPAQLVATAAPPS